METDNAVPRYFSFLSRLAVLLETSPMSWSLLKAGERHSSQQMPLGDSWTGTSWSHPTGAPQPGLQLPRSGCGWALPHRSRLHLPSHRGLGRLPEADVDPGGGDPDGSHLELILKDHIYLQVSSMACHESGGTNTDTFVGGGWWPRSCWECNTLFHRLLPQMYVKKSGF